MRLERHVTWENFRDNFLEPGDPAIHPVPGPPDCKIFVDKDGKRIGLRIQVSSSSPDLDIPFQHIEVANVGDGTGRYIEISSSVQSLYEQFYAMLTSISDLVQLHSKEPLQAIEDCAERFSTILSSQALLSSREITGLWCELWVLENLLGARGPEHLSAWIGPIDEPHDFQFDEVELEVKGTRLRKRRHLISSETQLASSPDKSLFLLSIQIAPGSGEGSLSLPDRVNRIRQMIGSESSLNKRYDVLLEAAKYDAVHERYYKDRFILRTSPTLVPIDADTPQITAEMLRLQLGPEGSTRISDVEFRLDVTNLGFEQSSAEFQAVLPTEH